MSTGNVNHFIYARFDCCSRHCCLVSSCCKFQPASSSTSSRGAKHHQISAQPYSCSGFRGSLRNHVVQSVDSGLAKGGPAMVAFELFITRSFAISSWGPIKLAFKRRRFQAIRHLEVMIPGHVLNSTREQLVQRCTALQVFDTRMCHSTCFLKSPSGLISTHTHMNAGTQS